MDLPLGFSFEGAKDVPNVDKNVYKKGNSDKYNDYHGTEVTVIVTYKKLIDASLRGDESQVFQSLLKGSNFKLKVYGTSEVIMNEVDLDELQATIYGESKLNINAGSIGYQQYTVYGEGIVNSVAINGKSSKITAYGESEFYVNVSDNIKINSFGESSLHYKGDAVISKGIQIGEMKISKVK